MSEIIKDFAPAVIYPPGEDLAEKLEEMKMDANDLASRIGRTPKTINEILKGKCSLSLDVAMDLECVTGISAEYWMRRQYSYSNFLAGKKREKGLPSVLEWMKNFPLADMLKRKWISALQAPADKVQPLFKFFALCSSKAWENYYYKQQLKVAFRISLAESRDPYAMSVWLRRGEILADEIQMEEIPDKTVRSNIKNMLPEFIALAQKSPSVKAPEFLKTKKKLQSLCAKANIKLLYVENFKTAPVHGASRWYKDIAVIQLHDGFETDGGFWYTFFHELGHILLHGKKEMFLKNVDYASRDLLKDAEADTFAQKQIEAVEASGRVF
ncbi:ImmA/IrrE family metallo-endopeptidase [Fibrobacter sp. UWEL]|uniref:ImmA/IrrE family metallo-endopeptidase n=1 Tax=Fibrobacter sp. UWEL TaxID=1896209 RepID=UPI00091ED427|nr:ImmA/IrrE family metallo-endopeptidase [Fibrobacter sp. UWEL]SHK94591.1 addiction module antidote protein, HigA family [Fibrobacter sp. UWEL]